jgi:hypothetical protein
MFSNAISGLTVCVSEVMISGYPERGGQDQSNGTNVAA